MAKLASVHFDGLDTFLDELRVLQANLVEESNAIMVEAAEAAQTSIIQAYPLKSGNLRKGMTLRPSRGRVITGATLRNRAPHAHLYEDGTEVRKNKRGDNRGFSKPHPTFRPIALKHWQSAISAINDLLYQHGAASVTGDATAA